MVVNNKLTGRTAQGERRNAQYGWTEKRTTGEDREIHSRGYKIPIARLEDFRALKPYGQIRGF